MTLDDAKAQLTTWWDDELPMIKMAGGHSVQRGLDEQVQRIVLDRAHLIASQAKFSREESAALVAFAIEHCEPPQVKAK